MKKPPFRQLLANVREDNLRRLEIRAALLLAVGHSLGNVSRSRIVACRFGWRARATVASYREDAASNDSKAVRRAA